MGVQNIPGSRFPELTVRSESQLLSENQRPEDINPNPQIPKSVTDDQFSTPLTPDTRHLKPMLGEGFTTPDNVQKKELFS